MKKIFFVVSFLLMSSLALAAIPKYVTVQGRLTDVNDVPVPSGSYPFNFTIWNDSTAGTLIWTDQFNAQVSNGVFNIELGRNAQLNIPFDQPYFLEVKVGGNLLTPRVNFTSTAYAFTSASGGGGGGGGGNGWAVSGSNVYNTTSGVKVGIGTASPLNELDVVGDVNATGNLYTANGMNIRYTNWVGGSSTDPGVYSNQLYTWMRFVTNSGKFFWFTDSGTGTTPTMGLDYNNSGKFGIGTGWTSPNAKLEISGSGATGLSFNASNDLIVNDTSGRVGIGTPNPTARITVGNYTNGANDGTHGLEIRQTDVSMLLSETTLSGTNAGSIQVNKSGTTTSIGATAYNLALQPYGGNVGIGLANPSYLLQLSSDSAAKPSTTTWTVSSDARLKTNISNFTEGLDIIMKIRPVTYSYNGLGGFVEDGKMKVGIIAQELQPVAPYMIGTYEAKLHPGDKNETELLNYNGNALSFVTVNAIKEQQEQIDQLKSENLQLKQKIEEIEKKLNSVG